MSTLNPDLLVFGGDFNEYLNVKLDKKGGRDCKPTNISDVINCFLEENDWVDTWRYFNPDRFQYTYKRKKP